MLITAKGAVTQRTAAAVQLLIFQLLSVRLQMHLERVYRLADHRTMWTKEASPSVRSNPVLIHHVHDATRSRGSFRFWSDVIGLHFILVLRV